MAVKFPLYAMKDGKNGTRLSESYFNPVFQDLDSRLDTLEQLNVSWIGAVAELQQFGLARIDQYIGPLIDDTEATLAAAQASAALAAAIAESALDDVNTALAAHTDTIDAALAAHTSSINDDLAAQLSDVNDALAAQLSSVNTSLDATLDSVADDLAAQTTTVNDAISAQTTSVNNAIAAQNASVAAKLAIPPEYGDGRDGILKMGSITATVAAPTVSASGSGDLNATYYYKVSLYNFSGETTPSSASASITPSNQKVTVTIPAASNNTNVTGYHVYRSTTAGGTYYRVGTVPVDDVTLGTTTFVDDIGISSGVAPQGSNTTGTSVTTEGIYYVKSGSITTGQTVTITSNTTVGLRIISQGDFTMTGSIVGTGKQSNSIVKYPITSIQRTNSSTTYSYTGINFDGVDAGINSNALGTLTTTGIGATEASVLANLRRFMGLQGSGGSNGTTKSNAGATVLIAANGTLDVAGGSIIVSGNAGIATSGVPSGGAAAGTILLFGKKIKRASATLTANGGAGTVATSGTRASSGGGAGGLVGFITDYLVGSSTNSVAGGASAAGFASATSFGASGGAWIGDGGATSATTGASTAGTSGLVLEVSPKKLNFSGLI